MRVGCVREACWRGGRGGGKTHRNGGANQKVVFKTEGTLIGDGAAGMMVVKKSSDGRPGGRTFTVFRGGGGHPTPRINQTERAGDLSVGKRWKAFPHPIPMHLL